MRRVSVSKLNYRHLLGLLVFLFCGVAQGCIDNETQQPVYPADQIPFLLHNNSEKSWELVEVKEGEESTDFLACPPAPIYRFTNSADSLNIANFKSNCDKNGSSKAGLFRVDEEINRNGQTIDLQEPLLKFFYDSDSVLLNLRFFSPNELRLKNTQTNQLLIFQAVE